MAEARETPGMTNRLLIIAAAIAVAAGAVAWYFSGQHAAALEEVEEAKDNYSRMAEEAPSVYNLVQAALKAEKGGGARQDPVTYLGTVFSKHGFPRPRYTVSRLRDSTVGNWTERTYKVDFPRRKDDPFTRSLLVQTLAAIERERPDLRTKDLTLDFEKNDLTSATVIFVQYEVEEQR
ncbi:MAG: hypothetical protein ACYTAF_06125 [Planctomycetota bacterium]|jgi:hypothetical protein